MASGLLEESLRDLHANLKDGGQSELDQIDSIVPTLSQICLHEITEKDIDYCSSVLFDKEIGVTTFLQKISKKNEYQGSNAKYGLLELLSDFIHKVGKKALPYLVEIKEASLSNYMTDRFTKIKSSALPVLIKVLELSVGSNMGEDLKIQKFIEKFFMELTKASKLTATGK
ncbi:hypothetical protein LOTGIDRAFT_174701 [Lottia gigantea]|uniref:DNA-PKcs N-terminal domain-containing protein n=1 Tax=Lottia gigantea TaxID=225164 RepID=V4AIE8_LOTGI|nr:hypothetical protein LOTGIDRAFT_174701 [Lottia gigantea]ESO96747.1 hypothetical protein LOTGIDRAFT_174701 [Lottia gigantea]